MVSPEILELDSFEELDLNPSQSDNFPVRALGNILTHAARSWPRLHTLSLVDSNFMGSYERKAMSVLFGSLPAHTHTLKVSGMVSLMIDQFDPATGDNGERVPLNFDVIDMSDIHMSCIEDVSALTESFLERFVRGEGRHTAGRRRPRIIFPHELATTHTENWSIAGHEGVLANPVVYYKDAKDVPVAITTSEGGAPGNHRRRYHHHPRRDTDGPPTFHQVAVAQATKHSLLKHIRTSTLYRAGWVELFQHILDTPACCYPSGKITAAELELLAVLFAIVLADTNGGGESVQDVMASELENTLLPLLTSRLTVPVALYHLKRQVGLTSVAAIEQLLPAWTHETTARWELIKAALSVDHGALEEPMSAFRQLTAMDPGVQDMFLWLIDPCHIDVVNAPLHIAEVRKGIQAYYDWHGALRATSVIIAATQRDLDATAAPANGGGAGGAGGVPRTRTLETMSVVSVLQQWMLA